MSDVALDPIQYLASKGHHGRQATGDEVAFACFMACGEPADSRKRKLYVNSADGFWQCKVCGEQGGTYLLMQHFGDDPKVNKIEVPGAMRRELLTKAAKWGAEALTNSDEQMIYLLDRGLSPETIIERQFGLVQPPWSLADSMGQAPFEERLRTGLVHREGERKGKDFFYDHLLIPYQARGSVVQIRGRGIGRPGYFTGPGERAFVYNSDDLDHEDILITEGEFDTAILKQHTSVAPDQRVRDLGVVGLPGVQVWPEGFIDALQGHRRIYAGFDSDDAGQRAAVKMKELLGAKLRIIEWPEDLVSQALADGEKKVDWTLAFVKYGWSWRSVATALGAASGRRIHTVSETAGLWRRAKKDQVGLQLGFAQLDATIEPGLLPGQLMIPLAKTGTGKTLWLCNVTYNLRDRHVLYVTLEMTRTELYERLQRIYLFHHPLATQEEIEAAYSKLAICDENRLANGDLSALTDEYEAEWGVKPDLVIVDYLGYYARGFKGGSPYEKTSDAVMELKAQAKGGGFAVIAPHQVNRMGREGKPLQADDARDSGVVEETADFMLSLYRPDDAIDQQAAPSGKLRMGLLKSRHGGKDRTFTLQMALLSLAIVDDLTTEAKAAVNENWLAFRGETYDEMRARLTAPVQRAFPAPKAR